jgi:hypothetical protein
VLITMAVDGNNIQPAESNKKSLRIENSSFVKTAMTIQHK